MAHSQEASASSSWDVDAGLNQTDNINTMLTVFGNTTEGDYEVPDEAPVQPPADAAIAPAVLPPVLIQEADGSDIVRAQVYGIDEVGLKDDHEDLKDVKVGQEVLVVNPTLMGITFDQLESNEDVQGTPEQANILEQISPGMDTKYTAAVAPFTSYAATSQLASADVSSQAPIDISTLPRQVESALVPSTPLTVLEKDGEDVEEREEEPAKQRLAGWKDPESTFNHAGPSSPNCSL